MKKGLILFLLLPLIGIAQVSDWRKPSTSSSSSSSSQSNSVTNRSNDSSPNLSIWRKEPPKQTQNYTYTPPRRPLNTYYSPNYFGPNRWFGWGAPLYYDYYTPYFYYNNWGYREPARIYYREGRQDTVRGKKVHFSFGLNYSVLQNEFGGWTTIGDRTFLILDFMTTVDKDESFYVSNKTIWNYYNDVMTVNGVNYRIFELFPLEKNYQRNNLFYVGLGKKIKRLGGSLSLGVNRETQRYRYKDDVGFISFPKSNKLLLTCKMGVIHDVGPLSLKIDVDPVVGRVFIGTGLNF